MSTVKDSDGIIKPCWAWELKTVYCFELSRIAYSQWNCKQFRRRVSPTPCGQRHFFSTSPRWFGRPAEHYLRYLFTKQHPVLV